jgi:predicted phosphoadenosine phosphosulfate sulfurtransferase
MATGTAVTAAQGTLWPEEPVEVTLADYQVILVSSSGGKDSAAMLAHLVDRARREGVLDRLVVVHADLSASPRRALDNVEQQGCSPVSGLVADVDICRWLTTIENVLRGQRFVVQWRDGAPEWG